MPTLRQHLRTIGRRGGLRSRRRLDPEAARDMVRVREARRAYHRFHTYCFPAFPADLRITREDLAWVADRLRRLGDARAQRIADKLEPADADRRPGDDVDPVVRRMQIASFRRMSAQQKLELADQLGSLARELRGARDVAR